MLMVIQIALILIGAIAIACDCCDENNVDDFEEIALLIGYLDKGKKLKPLPLSEFAI